MLMDVAERYLIELAQRSLIQLKPTNDKNLNYWEVEFPWLTIHSCQLHDLIRDLRLSKGKEEDILKIIDFLDEHNELHNLVDGMEALRIAIHMYGYANSLDISLEQQQHMVGRLRSLLFFIPRYLLVKLNINLKDFKLVRVLKLDGFELKKKTLAQEIVELILLRYLSLRGGALEELPPCIGDLRYKHKENLQMLLHLALVRLKPSHHRATVLPQLAHAAPSQQ